MSGHKGVVDDLRRGKDTLCSCPGSEGELIIRSLRVSRQKGYATDGVDFLLDLL